MAAIKPRIEWYIGTIGFGYDDWRDVFYPRGMKASSYLAHYSLIFNAVEIDSTFHAVPRSENLLRWVQLTPEEFIFCAKMPKVITHSPKLTETGLAILEFTQIIRALERKLAVVLIQFPPSVRADNLAVMEKFFTLLPPDLRYAVEVRHQTWYTANPGDTEPALARTLRRHGICWASTDYPRTPMRIIQTTDFLYIRWIGQHGTFIQHNSERIDRTRELKSWEQLIEASTAGIQTVYGFFNNDYAGFAPGTANRFKNQMNLPVTQFQPAQQARLF
jgi:uncharacterized protein YecE (DUF72 family)